MRFHCMAVILVLYWCCFFVPTAAEFAAVMLCFGLVTALECVNTAVEALSDKLTGERHPLIRIAKDAAAGAVLLAAAASAVCGCMLFFQQPRFGVAVRRIFTSPLWGSVFAVLIFGAFCFIFVLPTPEKKFSVYCNIKRKIF